MNLLDKVVVFIRLHLFRQSCIFDDLLVFILFGENVFKVDSVLARVDSFEGVKTADAFIITEVQYYDDWAIREIDKRLPPQLVRKSVKKRVSMNPLSL
jgi:hypothetical protein